MVYLSSTSGLATWLLAGGVLLIATATGIALLPMANCSRCGRSGVLCSDCEKGVAKLSYHAACVSFERNESKLKRLMATFPNGEKVESLDGTLYIYKFPTKPCGECREGKVSVFRSWIHQPSYSAVSPICFARTLRSPNSLSHRHACER